MIAEHTFTMMNPRDCPYMDYIKRGIKLAEGRIYSPRFRSLKINDTIYFHNRRIGIICKITSLNRYTSFEKMLKAEKIDNMLPQLRNKGLTEEEKIKEGVKIYKSFPNSHKIEEFGCIAIGVKFLEDHFPKH